MRVIKNLPKDNTIIVDQISHYHYIVTKRNDGLIGVLVAESFNSSTYTHLCVSDGFTEGNNWHINSIGLKNTLNELLENNIEVFAFDTAKEMAVFLAKEL